MRNVGLGIVQLGSQEGIPLDQVVDHVADQVALASKGSDLVMLPEMWTPGYFAFDSYAAAALDGGRLTEFLSGLAERHRVILHGGSIVLADGDHLFNTSLLFGRSGELLAGYRKLHLFGYGSREPEVLTQGPSPTVVDTEVGRVGLAVCYDLRFPELFRRMVDDGAEMALVASAWPYPRLPAWRTLCRARALENQMILVAANGTGATSSGPALCGHSTVVDPWGVDIASAGDDPATIVTTVDLDCVADARTRFRQLADRRLLDADRPVLGFTRPGQRPLRFEPSRTLIAGYTGRDVEAVRAYVRSLEQEGVAAPPSVPAIFTCGSDRVVSHAVIDVTGDQTCGEIEFVLLVGENGAVHVTVGSDHTDRALEKESIPLSKQIVPKVVATEAWPLEEVRDHWDRLVLKSWVGDDDLALYQETGLDFFLTVEELFAHLDDPYRPGTVIFGGTVSSVDGRFDYAPRFRGELHDPVLGRSLVFEYRTRRLEGS